MSPLTVSPAHVIDGFPRVSGDEPLVAQLVKAEPKFSPRERG